jgi:hypothetical protein
MIEKFYLLFIAGPSSVILTPIDYIVLFVMSLAVGKFIGEKRYIGFIWSTLFFFLMPLLNSLGIIFSLTIILLSPKLISPPPKGTSRNLYWAIFLIVFGGMAATGMLISPNFANENIWGNGGFMMSLSLILISFYLFWIYRKFHIKTT